MISLVLTLVIIAVFLVYQLTLQNLFKDISPENRLMPPGQVWLLPLPFFNLFWPFTVVARLLDSLKNEFEEGGIGLEGWRPVYTIDTRMGIFMIAGIVSITGGQLSFCGLVCWLLYWIKLNG